MDLIPSALKRNESSEVVSKSHEGEMTRANSATLTLSAPGISPNGLNGQCLIQTKSKSHNIDEEKNISAQLVASIYKSIGLLDAYRPVAKFTIGISVDSGLVIMIF